MDAEKAQLEGSSLLEMKSVQPTTLESYRRSLEAFLDVVGGPDALKRADDEVDDLLVRHFTAIFMAGRHPCQGERVMASLMMLHPSFSLRGTRRTPRAWRALRGWRNLTPVVSRKPLPWTFWAGVATRLLEKNRPSMGLFTLLCVSTYMRPSELMSIRQCDLIAPAPGVLPYWSMLLFPEGRAEHRRPTCTTTRWPWAM